MAPIQPQRRQRPRVLRTWPRRNVGPSWQGPEPEEAIRARHARSLALAVNGTGQMFRISVSGGPGVGSVGYWEREWRGGTVYEMGWMVLPEHQGQGVASAAVRLAAEHAATFGRHGYVHAYPKVANAASNAVCRKAGFELLGEVDFEYPKGTPIRSCDWRLDLRTLSVPEATSDTVDDA